MGQTLRDAREKQGISLAELTRRTQIRERFIEALETEDFEGIPGGAPYVKGFVRRLCQELNLDFEQVYRAPKQVIQSSEAVSTTVKAQEGRGPNLWSIIGIILMVLAAVASVAYWFLMAPKTVVAPPVVTPPHTIIPPPVPPEPPAPPVERPAFVFAGEEQGVLIYVVERWPMELKVTVREQQCWVLIDADAQGGRSRTLTAGQSFTTTAENSLRMRLGRARVVDIAINGHLLPRLNEDVKDFVFRKTGP